MSIVWTRRAALNLHEACDFIRRENPAAAARIGLRIESAVSHLERFPESGHTGRVPGTREVMVPGLPYFIVYRVIGGDVQILRLLHAKQKWPPPV